jgi:hypothetical protein
MDLGPGETDNPVMTRKVECSDLMERMNVYRASHPAPTSISDDEIALDPEILR